MQNSVNLVGRLTKDIEVKTFDSGDKIANFCIAVQRNFKNRQGDYESDFINCQARNNTADFLFKYFKKGDFCPVTGEIRTRKYEKDGENRTATYVDVSNVTFVSSRKSENTEEPAENTVDNFESFTPSSEEDLPF